MELDPIPPVWNGMVSAREAHQQARTGNRIIGWKLPDDVRKELLQRFAPSYRAAIADHVTLSSRRAQNSTLPDESECEIVGRSDDGQGVEALVVRIGGTTRRPDGGIYHITWSLQPGRKAKESNDVIATTGWDAIDPPVRVKLVPACFTWNFA